MGREVKRHVYSDWNGCMRVSVCCVTKDFSKKEWKIVQDGGESSHDFWPKDSGSAEKNRRHI